LGCIGAGERILGLGDGPEDSCSHRGNVATKDKGRSWAGASCRLSGQGNDLGEGGSGVDGNLAKGEDLLEGGQLATLVADKVDGMADGGRQVALDLLFGLGDGDIVFQRLLG